MGPINYSLQGIQTPFQSLAGGFQMGSQMAQAQAMRQEAEARAAQQQQALLQQQAAAEQQRMLSEQLMALRNKPNPTARDYENLAMFLPKDRSEAMLNWFNTRSKEEQGNLLAFNGQVLSAAETKPEVAVNLLRERATAERNKGNEADAKGFELQANLIEQDPKMARVTLAPVISRLPGGKDVLEGVAKALEVSRAQQLFPSQLSKAESEAITAASNAAFADQLNKAGLDEKNWNIRAAQNKIRIDAARLGLDQQRTAAEVALNIARVADMANGLPDSAKTAINDAAIKAGTSKQQAAQFNSLADRLQQAGGGYGFFSSIAEWTAKATGRQDYMSELRQEFTRLRNNAAIQSLPPGPATDKDIAMVLEGFPPSNADSRTMASFLRGMAKLQDINSTIENARVDWLSSNRGSMTKARQPFTVGDLSVAAGDSWVDVSARLAQGLANRYAAGAGGAPRQPSTAIPGAPVQSGQVAPASPYSGMSNDEILRRLTGQ
jgi:hypothetical protein